MNGLSRWKIALYLAGIFCAGAVSGWVLAAKTVKEQMFAPPRPDEIAHRLLQRLEERLELTPEQVKVIRGVLEDSAKQIRALHEKHMKGIWDAINQRNARILAQLTPRQQAEFKRMEEERRRRWQRLREQWRSRRALRGHRPGGGTNPPAPPARAPGLPPPPPGPPGGPLPPPPLPPPPGPRPAPAKPTRP